MILIDYMVDWGGDMSETDQPRLGSGNYNGIPGGILLNQIKMME